MKARTGKRRGFTLVELLVVISIIGMLMAMLLPAVQAAREASRANTCRNNLKNLSLAITTYDSQKGQFPGFANDIVPTAAAASDNHYRSWTFVLLPFLDKRSVYDQYKDKDINLNVTANGTLNADITLTIEVLNCPSNPPELLGTANTSYVANIGQIDRTPTTTYPTRDYAGNGAFHYRAVATNLGGMPPTYEKLLSMTSSYISGADGMGTTIMLSENADAYTWVEPTERYAGFGYHNVSGTPGTPGTTPNDPMHINIQYGQSKTGAGVPLVNNGYMRPSAYHPSGVNMAFCDGHVRFISEDIAYGVYQALMTTRGAQSYDNANNTGFVGTTMNPGTPPDEPTKIIDEASVR